MDQVEIISLSPDRWEEYRDLRLRALKEDPEAFGMKDEEVLHFSEDKWRIPLLESQQDDNRWNVFAQKNGELVGMMTGKLLSGEDYDVVKVMEVFVAKEVRGKGIGKELFSELINQIRSNPEVKKVRFKVFKTQIDSIEFYKSLGCQIKAEITETWPDGRSKQTLVMEKVINGSEDENS